MYWLIRNSTLQRFPNLNVHGYIKNENDNCKTKSNMFADIINNEIINNKKSKTRYRYSDKIKVYLEGPFLFTEGIWILTDNITFIDILT